MRKNILPEYFRVLDVNFNRAREGLRVAEDLARFILNDRKLAEDCKVLRHRLSVMAGRIEGGYEALLDARLTEEDVGRPVDYDRWGDRKELEQLALANLKRAQEAVRVLEEILASGELKEIRYQLYVLEKEIILSLSALQRWQVDYTLYVITGEEFSAGRPTLEVIKAALAGGATVIQLREKNYSTRRLMEVGRELRRLTREWGAVFIVNDRVDVALAVEADGVHVGQDDMPVEDVRRLVGNKMLIGVSVSNLEEARAAVAGGADYLGAGPVYSTTTKADAGCPVGPELIARLVEEVRVPVVAIGGINSSNAAPLIAAGAAGVAVISSVVGAADVKEAARELKRVVLQARGSNFR